MKTLYVDNYRGFTHSFIPFCDVNFLVGENSTGKTSILNLINILNNSFFWLFHEFNTDEVTLGYFHEIVNQNAAKKSHFCIGLEEQEYQQEQGFQYILMQFNSKEDIPSISKCFIYDNTRTIYISFSDTQISYAVLNIASTNFNAWIEAVRKTKVTRPATLMKGTQRRGLPFRLVVQLVRDAIDSNGTPIKNSGSFKIAHSTSFTWLSPIRAKPQRMYDAYKQVFSPDGEHAPIMLKELFASSSSNSKKLIEKLEQFGKESSLFDNLEVSDLGKIKGSPFSILVKYNDLPIRITNVGYGVSQILPIILQILMSRNTTFAIQQPEVHLHPKAQAAFGDFIYQAAKDKKHNFIIETHSDYTINRFRYNMHKNESKTHISGQILFFERTTEGTTVTSLPFQNNGQYSPNTPEAYGKFFIDEEIKMLEF